MNKQASTGAGTELSFSQNMTATPAGNLTDQIFTEEKVAYSLTQMLSARISTHKRAMTSMTILHLGLVFLTLVQSLRDSSKQSKLCGFMHFSNRLVYLGLNFLFAVYFGHLARNAKIQSMDIYIFDFQKKIVRGALFLPLALIGNYLLSTRLCPSEPLDFSLCTLYFGHLLTEICLLLFYLDWYQAELRKYGGDSQQPDTAKNNETFDK